MGERGCGRMETDMTNVFTIILAILSFLVIITIHEFGHFITAKLFKVGVPEFSIGFGPEIFKKKKGETQYSVRLLPLGGFVRLEGEDEESSSESALGNKPVWQRMIIVAAGATLNILLGLLVYTVLYSQVSEMPLLKVDEVYENTPAYEAVMPGDEIIAVNGGRVWYYKDFKFLINTNDAGKPIKITVKRENEKKSFNITPIPDENGVYIIGIKMATEKNSFLKCIKYGFYETFFMIKVVFYSLFMLVSGKVPLSSVSGPVGTVSVMSEAARNGLASFANLFALLTVNIGIFNLLPIPALDGGRVFFMLVELVRGKPIDPKKEGMVHFVGLVLLLLLMFIVTIGDISSLIGKM